MKRTALRPSTKPLRRFKPLPQASKKQAKKDRQWAKTSVRIRAERPWCEAPRVLLDAIDRFDLTRQETDALVDALKRCTGRSQVGHHVFQRAVKDGLPPDSDIRALCNWCHLEFVHREIALAHRIGLLRHSWEAS